MQSEMKKIINIFNKRNETQRNTVFPSENVNGNRSEKERQYQTIGQATDMAKK